MKKALTFFKPMELAILATYLKKQELLAPRIATLEAHRIHPPGEWNEQRDGIALEEGTECDSHKYALSNAVARICLSNVQEHLPQWRSMDEEGRIVHGRKTVDPLALPPRILLPQFLFTINWANSAPGYSWPEAYYATAVPFFDVTIVSFSQDSTDFYGYCDVAIGWFGKSDQPEAEIGSIINGHWKHLADVYGQQRWVELIETGLIDGAVAERWADKVWQSGQRPDKNRSLLDILQQYVEKSASGGPTKG